jgi:transposase
VTEPRRRRRWAVEQKRRIVEETRASGASVSVVARRYDINANLLFKWKREAEADQLDGATSETAEFVPIGVIGQGPDGGPTLLARLPDVGMPTAGDARAGPGELRRPSALAARPGVIEIDLPCGTRVRVDALVDTRALSRVLSSTIRRFCSTVHRRLRRGSVTRGLHFGVHQRLGGHHHAKTRASTRRHPRRTGGSDRTLTMGAVRTSSSRAQKCAVAQASMPIRQGGSEAK